MLKATFKKKTDASTQLKTEKETDITIENIKNISLYLTKLAVTHVFKDYFGHWTKTQ